MSRELRPAELCICRMVFGSLFVVICGFLLLNAIEASRFGQSTPVKVAVQPEPGRAIIPQPERSKRLPPRATDNSDPPRPKKSSSGNEPDVTLKGARPADLPVSNKPPSRAEPNATEPVSPSVMKVRLSRLGVTALERMVRFDSQPFEQRADVPGLGFAEVGPRPALTQSFQAKPEKSIVTASATPISSAEEPKIAEEEDTPARRKTDDTSPTAESLTEQQISRVKSRLHDLGFLSSAKRGGWDANARNALRDFKVANGLPNDDVWDVETRKKMDSQSAVRADRSIIGNWSTGPCRSAKPENIRLSVTARRAKSSGGSVCDFQDLKITAREWRVRAACSQGEKRWAANGKFSLSADKLVWSSERDVISYFRCETAVP